MDNKRWHLLEDDYIQHLQTYASELSVFKGYLALGLSTSQSAALETFVHRLANVCLTYGLSELSATASTTEVLVQGYNTSPDSINKNDSGALQNALSILLEQLEFCSDSMIDQVEQTIFNPECLINPLTSRPDIIVADNDPSVGIDLIITLIEAGLNVHFIESILQLDAAIHAIKPVVVICAVSFPEGQFAGIEFFQQMNQTSTSPLPVIFMSSEDNFDIRIASVRAGSSLFFTKPLDKVQLVYSVRELISLKNNDPYRILLVDGDEKLLQLYGESLEHAGYKVHRAATAQEGLALLLSENSEMILLDINLPDCTGFELGKVIRQHQRFVHIPILFMSFDASADDQLAAVRLAGDELMSKPIELSRLLMAVEPRIKRSRLMRNPWR